MVGELDCDFEVGIAVDYVVRYRDAFGDRWLAGISKRLVSEVVWIGDYGLRLYRPLETVRLTDDGGKAMVVSLKMGREIVSRCSDNLEFVHVELVGEWSREYPLERLG